MELELQRGVEAGGLQEGGGEGGALDAAVAGRELENGCGGLLVLAEDGERARQAQLVGFYAVGLVRGEDADLDAVVAGLGCNDAEGLILETPGPGYLERVGDGVVRDIQ